MRPFLICISFLRFFYLRTKLGTNHFEITNQCPTDSWSYWDDCFGTKEFYDPENWEDDHVYTGHFKDNQKHTTESYTYGEAIYKHRRQVYEGEWKFDKKDGVGTLRTIEGDVLYQGEWKNGVEHGIGTRRRGGRVYTGNFKNGEKFGRGVEEHNGRKQEGWWNGITFSLPKTCS